MEAYLEIITNQFNKIDNIHDFAPSHTAELLLLLFEAINISKCNLAKEFPFSIR